MQPYLSLISRARYFLIPWFCFLLVAGIILLTYPVGKIHLSINAYNNSFFDWLMPWVTLGADGWTIAVACLLMFAWNRRAAIFISLACLLPSAVAWLFKAYIFNGVPRPKWYFTNVEIAELHYVPGVDNWLYDSFPSGHTTVAFAFFFSIALCVRNRYFGFLLFIAALAVGFSRIYLSQHFLFDVYWGSVIGTLISLIVFGEAHRRNWVIIPVPKRDKD
jgi:membrane-associated phospholipid phosphatase